MVILHTFTKGKANYLEKFPEVNLSRVSFSPGEQVTLLKLYLGLFKSCSRIKQMNVKFLFIFLCYFLFYIAKERLKKDS